MSIFPTRQAVHNALFAQLQNIPGFNTYTQKATLPADITIQNSPLLSLMHGNSRTTYEANRIAREEWDAFVVIYFRNNDRTVNGASILDPLVDGVLEALRPNDLTQNLFVLKDTSTGAVIASWVRVEGVTVYESGDTDPEGLGGALIPLKLLIPRG